ncbi:unnamed protein product [Closterium sp. NIES-53]
MGCRAALPRALLCPAPHAAALPCPAPHAAALPCPTLCRAALPRTAMLPSLARCRASLPRVLPSLALSRCPARAALRCPTSEKSILAVGASRGDRRTPFFEGCSPVPLLPSVASTAAVDLIGTEEVGAASTASGRRRNSKGKSSTGGAFSPAIARASRPLALADPSGGLVLAHSSTVLPRPVAPSGLLSGLHLPSFTTNLVSGADLQDAWVDQFAPGGSSLYTLTNAPPPVSASGQVAASSQGHERDFLLIFDDYSRYTTVFPLRSKGKVLEVLIDWIRGARRQLNESFGSDLPILRLHSDRGGEFSSDLLRAFCRAESIRQTFTLPATLQQSGIAERRIGMVMDVARTSMIHAAAPHFLWPFAVQYAVHQINLQPRVSLSETTPTLRWTGKVGNASAFRVWGSRAFVRDTSSALGVPSRREPLSLQQLREWYSRRCRGAAGSGAAGATGGAAGGATGAAGGAAGAGAAGGATGAGGAAGAGAAGAAGGAAGAAGGTTGAGGAAGTVAAGAARGAAGIGAARAAGSAAGTEDPGAEGTISSCVACPYCLRWSCFRPHPPLIPGTHSMTLRPSIAPQRVPLPSPPASSLPAGPDPAYDSLHAASQALMRFLVTAVTDPLFESSAASALVTELVNFAAACRLDYATSLVAESASTSVCPSSARGECALGTDVLEDREEEFECFAAAVPHLVSMLLAPEGDPDAPDIPTPHSYAEAIEGPNSSQWTAAMDAEMASWKSKGTYVDKVPPPGANIVSGMRIFKVKWPPGSPPAFKARYVARGFSQRQGVDFFQTFSPTPKMTTLRVLLYVAAQRDYELHSLDFSTAFLQGSLHEEIWLRRPPGFTGSFPAGTQWSLRRSVYGLRQAPREWHDTRWTTLAALGFAPSTSDPSLFLRTDTTLPPFYILVYVDDLVFATADTEALAHVKSELQKRHTCTDLGELTSYLGLRITWDRAQRTITLTQSHMVQQVIETRDGVYEY